VALRRKPPAERKVAVLLYGFPPGVGATGTAALLNVPKSLEAVLVALRGAGYDLGEVLQQGQVRAGGVRGGGRAGPGLCASGLEMRHGVWGDGGGAPI
jgi:magnesium chelatase subunit H